MALEMVKRKTLDSHNPHDGLRRGFCKHEHEHEQSTIDDDRREREGW